MTEVFYTGDGVTTDFVIPFPFLAREAIKATVNGSPATFTWVGQALIRITPAPVSGATIRIYRETPTTPFVTFADGSTLTATSLNKSAIQPLHISEEARDNVAGATATANSALSQAQTATTIANNALQTAQDALTRVINAGNVPGPLGSEVGRVLAATGVGTFGWRDEVPLLRLSNAPTAADHATRRDYVDQKAETEAATQATAQAATRVAKSGDTMTGALLLPPSTPASAPALSFDGDSDTGLRLSAANTVAVSAGGVDRLTVGTAEITSALPLVMVGNKITGLADGTAAADAVNKGQLDAAIASIPQPDIVVSQHARTVITTSVQFVVFTFPDEEAIYDIDFQRVVYALGSGSVNYLAQVAYDTVPTWISGGYTETNNPNLLNEITINTLSSAGNPSASSGMIRVFNLVSAGRKTVIVNSAHVPENSPSNITGRFSIWSTPSSTNRIRAIRFYYSGGNTTSGIFLVRKLRTFT